MIGKTKVLQLLCTFLLPVLALNAQDTQDTTVMVKEFTKVMSFSTQPYISYNALIKINSVPVLEPQDTMVSNGVFYKKNTDLYYKNGQEDVYLQDSFFIQINQIRKTIWIRKVDLASKEKLNVLPMDNKQIQDFFRKKYTMQQSTIDGATEKLEFVTSQKADSATTIRTTIDLEYNRKHYLPQKLEMGMHMEQPLTEELLAALKSDNIDDSKLIQEIEGLKYLVRTQQVSVTFSEISTSKEKASAMPWWKEVLNYDEATQEFKAKGIYEGYEITKTF